jgi:hypothetical protein
MAIVQDFRFRSQAAFDEHVKKHGASFGGYLDLQDCTSLTSLPDGLTVGGSLYLTGCKIAPNPTQEHLPIKRVISKQNQIIWPFIARRNFGSSAYFLLVYNAEDRTFDFSGEPQKYTGKITECNVLPALKAHAVETLRALLSPEDLAAAVALSIKVR